MVKENNFFIFGYLVKNLKKKIDINKVTFLYLFT